MPWSFDDVPLLALGLCVLLAAGWTHSRRGRQVGSTPGFRVLARLPLEPRRALYVVQVAEQTLIVGSSESGLTSLGHVPPEQASRLMTEPGIGGDSPRFASRWARWLTSGGGAREP